MNLILFTREEITGPLPREDERAAHILGVLRRQPGEDFDVGLIDGPKGKAVLTRTTDVALHLDFTWGPEEPPLDPITLLVGLSRPQTNRKILREVAAIGVQRILFPLTDRAEPNYASSRLWTTGEYQRHLLSGVEQAFSTRVPRIAYGMPLEEAIAEIEDSPARYALDNYEYTLPMSRIEIRPDQPVAVAVGSERGWTGRERDLLRASGFRLAGMGARVLRTETAAIAALALVKSALGSWDS